MKSKSICTQCVHEFEVENKQLNRGKGKFCSNSCSTLFRLHNKGFGRIQVACSFCSKMFDKKLSQVKVLNHFCSKSCAASYNNKHKTHGTRRSKLEQWLEEQLTILYPELEFLFNRKDSIGSELDIYIPSLKLAFELNGIFHYEPIYGQTKLSQVQNNNVSKTKLCHEHHIDLCVIDTQSQKYFKPKSSKVFLDIIITIINERLIS